MSDSITMREAWRLDIEELKAERDEARIQYRSTLALAEALANTQIELKKERDEVREKLSHAQALLAEMQDALKLAVKELLKKNDA
jgi:aminoglycoside N3'-acetyltransferase